MLVIDVLSNKTGPEDSLWMGFNEDNFFLLVEKERELFRGSTACFSVEWLIN